MSLSIDPLNTYVVLIGTSEYQNKDDSDNYYNIPQIKNNIDSLFEVFKDSSIVGIPEDNIKRVYNESNTSFVEAFDQFLEEIKPKRQTTLIIYYSGHGLKEDKGNNELYLFATNTNKREVNYKNLGIKFSSIRDELKNSFAGNKIIILDCCHSGQVFSQEVVKASRGSYVIVSTENDEKAYYQSNEQYTAFSGELISVLEKGIDNSDNILTIKEIYQHLTRKFTKAHSISFNDIGDMSFAYNRYYESLERKYFKNIKKSLEAGKLIFFLGSGINFYPDKTDRKKFPPSDSDIAKVLAKNQEEDLTNIVGLPCQVCPVKLKKRPRTPGNPEKTCPIWTEIDRNNNNKKQLENEQNLTFARLEMRCRAQSIINDHDYGYDNLRQRLRNLFRDEWLPEEKHYEANETQKILAELANFMKKTDSLYQFLILTTNYDIGLEKEFDKQNIDFDVIYYYLDNKEFTGKFWHKSNSKETVNESCREITIDSDGVTAHIKRAIILKLYGGVLYKAKEEYDSFAISESHLINYLQNPKSQFPESLKTYLRQSDILFLGCNPNDSDLMALLYRFFPEKFSNGEKSKGWLINPLKPGEINNQDNWQNILWITLIDKCSSDNFLRKFKNYLYNLNQSS